MPDTGSESQPVDRAIWTPTPDTLAQLQPASTKLHELPAVPILNREPTAADTRQADAWLCLRPPDVAGKLPLVPDRRESVVLLLFAGFLATPPGESAATEMILQEACGTLLSRRYLRSAALILPGHVWTVVQQLSTLGIQEGASLHDLPDRHGLCALLVSCAPRAHLALTSFAERRLGLISVGVGRCRKCEGAWQAGRERVEPYT